MRLSAQTSFSPNAVSVAPLPRVEVTSVAPSAACTSLQKAPGVAIRQLDARARAREAAGFVDADEQTR